MTREEAIEALQLFNEKAEKLSGLSFSRTLRATRPSVTMRPIGSGAWSFERNGPETESIEAFVLTFRFFIQNNERSSFGNLEKVYSALGLPEHELAGISRSRRILNEWLDESDGTLAYKPQSRRALMELFVYGDLAHANRDQKALLDWLKESPLFPIFEDTFVGILFRLLEGIEWFKANNERVLREYGLKERVSG